MRFLLLILAGLLLIGSVDMQAQVLRSESVKFTRFNPVFKLDKQVANFKTRQTIVRVAEGSANTAFIDTTAWFPLPAFYNPLDSLWFGGAILSNLDSASMRMTAQFGIGGAPDSALSQAGAFVGDNGMPADSFAVARKTTVTITRANLFKLNYKGFPPGATQIRFFLAFQAAGNSTTNNGTQNDGYELQLTYPDTTPYPQRVVPTKRE